MTTDLSHIDVLTKRNLYEDLRVLGELKGYVVQMEVEESHLTLTLSGVLYCYVLDILPESVTVDRLAPMPLHKDYEVSDCGVVEAYVDLIRALHRH